MSKFLTLTLSITCFCLLYVYQQTEIFRMAYVGQKKQVILDDLLDKNSILRYNIESSASLVNIGDKVSGSTDYEMPDSYRLITMNRVAPKSGMPVRKDNMIARLFSVKQEAQAKTIP